VRRTHKIPFRTSRRSFQDRPRPSRRLAGSGIRGSRMFHCWSVNSHARSMHLLMTFVPFSNYLRFVDHQG
jgi:hypothetical protein